MGTMTKSGTTPKRLAMTGVPSAKASTKTRPKVSYQMLGNTKAAALLMAVRTASTCPCGSERMQSRPPPAALRSIR